MFNRLSRIRQVIMEDRRLAAIMFTDIVGYTKLMGSDEKKAFEVLRRNRNIQKPIIKKYRGKWLKEMGDGILASFNSAYDAVRCAGEIIYLTKQEEIGLRIGIHLGDVVFQGGDVLGDGVNVASRLEEMAEAGSIYISEAIYNNVKNKEGIKAEFIEERALKNVDEPVRIYKVHYEHNESSISTALPNIDGGRKLNKFLIITFIVIIVAIILWIFIPVKEDTQVTEEASIIPNVQSIAVLPFINDSPDEENEYFCNGMMEEILSHLQKISALQVKSRTDVEKYRNTSQSIDSIAKELNVNFMIEGSVRKYANRFRITTQLIDAGSGNHLWAETYDGTYNDTVFIVQADIAKKIASAIQAKITPQEVKRIDQMPTDKIQAYDLELRAHEMIRNWRDKRESTFLTLALNLYNRALEIDPEYIKALEGKALYYWTTMNIDSSLLYFDKMIAVDPKYSQAYNSKGSIFAWILNQPDSAITYISKAIELDPANHWANLQLGQVLIWRKDEVLKGIAILSKSL
jgi:adenylate cyclase